MAAETEFVKWNTIWKEIIIFYAFIWCTTAKNRYANQARLYSEHGHLFIVGADHSNITLKTSGGFINVNDQDLLFITNMAKKSSEFVERFQTSILPQLQGSPGVNNELLAARLRRLEVALSGANSTGVDLYKSIKTRLRVLTTRVNTLTRFIRSIRMLLSADECESSPCQNGGTCTDMFNGFHCHCTPGWQGAICEKDVNECEDFAGTELGCRNGATCRNFKGSYACTCPPGWYGIHCTERTYDCSVQSSSELCGNGICVNQGGTGRGFVCICNEGWTRNAADGMCTVDKNECAGPHRPCSHDPPVECHNTLGSFTCGNCPQGYTGNGYHCTDIDECEVNNGGCSPLVDCINLRGSRRCGPCPPGYLGDGITCTQGGWCKSLKNNCHPLATCIENPGVSYIECRCPAGYTGSGVGPDGCVVSTSNTRCEVSPCGNGGTCIPIGANEYKCKCSAGFKGTNCTETEGPCDSSPCKNGGTCQRFYAGNRLIPFHRCLCPSGFSGTSCENADEGCVAVFSGSSGTVRYPSGNFSISVHALTCAWTINTRNNKVINLTFTELNLYPHRRSHSCLTNFVEVYDGRSSAFPQIGHFCGPEIPPPVISTHPVLYILAKVIPIHKPSLRFNWTSIDPHCGGEINATVHGTLSSPGSPGRYPRNLHCIWKLFTNPGQRIQITFFSLDLEKDAACNSDYLEIRSGDSDTSPLLRKLCTSTLPSPMTTGTDAATIIFHSEGKGFQLTYAPKEGLPGCGGVFTTPRGQFKPPTNPGGTEYQEALSCEWLIELPQSEKIKATISSFSIEQSEGCGYDSLAVYDGPTKNSGLIGRWCGQTTIPPITSTSNALLVVFNSDYTMNEGGFIVAYKAVCGGTWTASEGVISSPYFPHHYPEDRTCVYLIERPMGYAIKVHFIEFDLEFSEDCLYDKLEIYDGNSENSPRIGQYCGNNKPGEIISTHNFLYMTFVTDLTEHSRGFQFNYTSIEISCGGILTGPTGTIKSPSYPDHYPPNQDCTWVISTKPGTVIKLTWLAFHVFKSYSCNQDWVAIFDNNTISSFGGQLGDKFCGNIMPPMMTSTSNVMSVVFHADGKNSEPGFTASYTTINVKEVCSGNYFTSAGHLSSPNFPNGYSNNLDCQWLISVPNGQQIHLTPISFSLENSIGCQADYLQISNGGHDAAPIIDKFCGSNFNRSIISMTNQLFLRFVTDSEDSAPGFMLIWDGAQTGCGGHMTSSSGAIMSPNYPQPYGRNGECTWKITVSEGSAIRLAFNDLDLEDHVLCSLDYLEVYDGINSHSPKLAKVCSQDNHPLAVNSKGNAMFLRFRSDASRQGRGFHLKYEIACNITIKGYRGVIESPGFPNTEDVPRECVWEIDAPKGNKVNISFSHFEFEEEHFALNVKGQYLNIYDSSISPNNLIGSYDYEVLPPRIKSSLSNHIFIHYKNPSHGYGLLVSKSVFRMEWIVSGCGGLFKKQKHGEISSPNYPKPYPHSTHCEWFITVHPGNSIKITIDDLQIEDSENCEYDALEVYGGPDESSPNLAKLCKKLSDKSPVILTTSGNEAFIRFRTDSSTTGVGFHAVYDLSPSECGGEFAAPYGSIHSHNYPQNYDEHDDCNFIIRVDPGHTVNLTFTDFDINAVDTNCTNSFVKVYDGDSEEAPLLNTLCGNRLPPSIFSSTNTLFIRHKAHGFSVAKGFYAIFQTACGAILETNSTDTLKFNEWDSPFTWNYEYNCTWIIRSMLPNSKIRLQFVMLEQNDNSEATQGPVNTTTPLPGLSILSGEGLDAPMYRHVSGNRIPSPIVVPSSVITVLYNKAVVSDSHPLRFVLDYSVLNTACGGTITADEGTIVSPGFADPFADATAAKQVECVWTLYVAPGNSMDLTFTKFNMLDSEPCNDNYVEIRSQNGAGSLIGTYCGTIVPPTITANGTLWIKYKTSSQDLIHGFEASFDLDTFNELKGFVGKIASPLYPLTYYMATSFSWRVSVKAGHVIRIAFSDFYMESMTVDEENWEDCYNSLVVYDGFDDSASVSKSFCGLNLPEPFTTDSNVIYIEMKHLYKGMATHFLLNWMQMERTSPNVTAVTKGNNCTTYVELKRGFNSSYPFKSPGFPNGYDSSLHCEWIFEAPVGDHVQIEFSTVNLESSRHCQYDFLTLYKGLNGASGEWVQMEKICEHNATTKDYIGTRLAKVVFTTDHSVNKTGFAGRARSVCGGVINAPNGVISEGPHKMCEWNITVKPGRTIAVTLQKFLVRDSPPCSRNFLMLRDGKTPDSPMLGRGRYCGEAIVEIPETKSNHLYVMYKAGSTEGFTLSFEEKSLSCGGTVFLSHNFKSTMVHSPNYPHVPSPHIECVWKIIGPSGESIHFEVNNKFDMAWSKGCKNEYVELREGSSEFGHFIGRYCSETPSFITTDGNSLYIKYFNDIDTPNDGFNATVSISKCGGTIYTNGENGTIFSPGYPDTYEGNLNCTWKLVASPTMLLSLNLTFSLGGMGSCNSSAQDTLSITENIQDDFALEGPVSMLFCSRAHMSIRSEINELFIHFWTFNQPIHGAKRFFIIDYKEIPRECGGKISASSGIIKSPYYPTSYQGRMYCSWRITVPEGRRVTFTLIDLDMVEATNKTRLQWLAFYNGFLFSRIKTLSGVQNSTTVIESSGNTMMITYRSFYKTTHRGFIGNFSSDKPALCGGTVVTNAKNGSLLVDKRLLQTNASFSCEWNVITPTTEPTTITFSFEGKLEALSTYIAECHYVTSRLIIFNQKSKKIGDFCSATKPNSPYLVSTPNTVTKVKVSKGVWENEPSNVNFTLNWRVDACGGFIVVSQPVTISSPGNDTYPPNTDCAWSLSAPEGSTIKISFNRFDLGTDCQDDYLKIFNGPTPLSPVIIYRCGSIVPADVISQSSNVWIHFHSGAPKSKKGFSLQVSEADSSCGGVLHLRKGEIRSPNYPSNYDNNIECDWEIQAPLGYHVGLVFNGRFFIEHTDGCEKDYVEISEYVDNKWSRIERVCGRDLSLRTYNSTTNRMRVFFKTNSNVTGEGFNATFNWNCGGLIEVTGQGDLYSPGWPGVYQTDLSCNYTLLAPQRKTITLRTDSFQLESDGPNGCNYDFVQFFTQKRYYNTLKSNGIYCGSTPPPVQTSAHKMNITFKTDDFVNYHGFHFIYSINLRCEVGTQVWWHSGRWLNCNEGGNRNNSPHHLPALTDSGHRLSASLIPLDHPPRLPYVAYPACGGEVNEETVITLRSIGSQSEQSTLCIWNITAPENRVVQVKISELSFSKVYNCHLESLTMYDTSNTSSNGTVLGKVCGTIDKTPAFFRSSGRKMKLKLQSFYHNLRSALTVAINFQYGPKSGCGGEISVAKTESKISSPDINRDGNYDDELDCAWTISTITGSTVLLSFESFHLKPCSTKDNSTNGTCCDVVQVYDGDSVNTQLIGRYCGSAIPRDISSSRNYLTLRFTSDIEGNAAGFRAKVTSHQSPCGQPVLTATKAPQFLTSPSYPENYSINIHCSWIISTDRFSPLHVRIEDLDIENSDDCSADSLEVSDVSKLAWRVQYRGVSNHLWNIYSGSGSPFQNRPMRSWPRGGRWPHGGLWHHGGRWRHGERRPTWGTSFGDLSRNVYVGSSSLIQNGNRRPTPNVYKFCGKKNAVDLYATSNQFFVKFFSDSHVTAKGFKLSYNIAGCSRNYTEPQGRIYFGRGKEDCVITITSQENSTISLYFISISIHKSSNGCVSKLSVFEGTNKTAEICGYTIPPPIFSSRNSLTLKISTEISRISYGFDLSYTTTDQGPGCGGTFYNTHGAFTSPSYPGNYRNSSYCCWDINVPLPNVAKVVFKDFDIGSKSTCFTDYIQLFDVDPDTGERILRTTYCGGDKPADFIGTGQNVAVCYKTSIHNSGIGWSALFFSYTENPNVPALLSVHHI